MKNRPTNRQSAPKPEHFDKKATSTLTDLDKLSLNKRKKPSAIPVIDSVSRFNTPPILLATKMTG